MKFNHTLMTFLCAAALSAGCSSETDNFLCDADGSTLPPTPGLNSFAPDDGAQSLSGSYAQKVLKLLLHLGPDVTKGFGKIQIAQNEYEEIKSFTDQLVKDCENEEQTYKTIFKWVVDNVTYAFTDDEGNIISNEPYPVFKTHKAVCQGYSNLLHVMLESQGIPTLNVNGDYVRVGGHAWNYVFYNNRWWVSDATNNGTFSMMAVGTYQHLAPYSIDADLFETDDCVFTYSDKAINIDRIKSESSQFIVPFSVGGFRVTSLSPSQPVPSGIKEIFIGKNITTLGEYYIGLDKNAPSIEAAYVDPENRSLESYTGAVYKKKGNARQLYYVPAQLKSMELLPTRTVEKNAVCSHKALEEVIIPAGTQEVCDYAFEDCPQLRVAYIPEATKVAEKAFFKVHPDFKIVRADHTGIPEIHL